MNVVILTLIGYLCLQTPRKLKNPNENIILSLLLIFAISGRILLAPLPNIQPVTTIILLIGALCGMRKAVIGAFSVILLSNLILGHGLWTIYQGLGWSIVGIMGGLCSKNIIINDNLNFTKLISLGIISAFLFDWIVSLSILPYIDNSLFLTYLINGVPYDLLHASGNIFFIIWLATPIKNLILKGKNHSIKNLDPLPLPLNQ